MKWYHAAILPMTLLAGHVAASEGVDDVIHLEKSHISEDVQMAYVQNAPTPFDPTADEITDMQREGVSASVIVAMIDHGKELKGTATDVASTKPVPAETNADAEPTAGVYESPGPYAPRPNYRDGESVEVSAFYAPQHGDVNISFFYGSLAPYGTWQHMDGYGYVWRPRIVATVSDWQPYATAGHWVWTDHGWYWESDYPWGWAAFHYGRWYNDPHIGWVWVPDTTWGPAWVNWRRSERYYGWAPLPPDARYQAGVGFSFRGKNVGIDFQFGLVESSYTFVPSGSFLAADISTVRVPHREVREVYNRTTVINNTYIYNDNRIINQGVPVDAVQRASNRQVETVQVTDMSVAAGQTFQRGEVREGRRIQAFRPAVQNASPETPEKAAQTYALKRSEAIRRSPNRAAQQQATPQATPRSATTAREADAQLRLEQEKSKRNRVTEPQATQRSSQAVQPAPDAKAKAQLQAEEARRDQARKASEEQAKRKLDAEKAQRENDAKARAQQQAEEARRDQARKASEEQAKRKLDTEKAQRENDAKAKAQQQAEEARRDQARKASEEQAKRKLDAEKAQRENDSKAKAQQQAEEARRNEARQKQAPQPDAKKTEESSFLPAPETPGRGRKGRK